MRRNEEIDLSNLPYLIGVLNIATGQKTPAYSKPIRTRDILQIINILEWLNNQKEQNDLQND